MPTITIFLVILIIIIHIQSLRVRILDLQTSPHNTHHLITLSTSLQSSLTNFTIINIPQSWSFAPNQPHTLMIPIQQSNKFIEQFIEINLTALQPTGLQVLSIGVIHNNNFIFIDNSLYRQSRSSELLMFEEAITDNGRNLSNLMRTIQQRIRGSQNSISLQMTNISNIYQQLPTFKELDRLIEQNQLLILLRLINQLINNRQLNCLQRINYLSELEIKLNKKRVEDRQKMIQSQSKLFQMQTKRAIILKNLKKWQQQYQSLNLEQSNGQILERYQELSQTYLKQQAVVNHINNLQQQIIIDTANRQELLSRYRNQQQEINTRRIELIVRTFDPEIRFNKQMELQNTIKARRQSLMAIRQINYQNQVNQYYQKQNQTVFDSLRIQGIQLQGEIRILQRERDIKEKRQKELRAVIDQYQGELTSINLEQAREGTQKLQITVDILQNNLPMLVKIIQTISLGCFGLAPQDQISQSQQKLIYVLKYSDFLGYIRDLFDNQIMSTLAKPPKVEIQRFNVFSQIWEDVFAEQPAHTVTLIKQEGFTCLAEIYQTSSGIVEEIKSTIIKVSNAQGFSYLILGACSTIYSVDGSVPKEGSVIFWRGQQIGKNVYDTHLLLTI